MNKISRKNKIQTKCRSFVYLGYRRPQLNLTLFAQREKEKQNWYYTKCPTQHNWNFPLHRPPHVQRSLHHSHSPPSLYPQKNVSRENLDKNENNNKKLRILGSTLRHLLQMEKVGQKYKWLRREFGQFWAWILLWWRRACVYYAVTLGKVSRVEIVFIINIIAFTWV